MSGKKRKISAIKGTKDILPREARHWQKLENASRRIFELYGYREIRAPIFEPTELFEKGTGATSDVVNKEMYTFIDKGGRSITLRPEYTPSVARAVLDNGLHLLPQPLRFYYIGPMFRYDKPQKGRYRQFHQADIEVFGEDDPALDAEIVEMADHLLRSIDVTGVEILVNSVGCPKCRPKYHRELKDKAEASRDVLCDDCRHKISANPLRIFDCKRENCREVSQTFPKITDFLCPQCRQHFDGFLAGLDSYGIEYRIEPRLVRGLDYYTKTTFEFVSADLGAQDSILGGGRYDDLMAAFGGPDLCGIGFAMGIERLLSVMPFQPPAERWVYVAYLGEEAKRDAMQTARYLRRNGIECLIEYKGRGLKNQMSRASRLQAAWTLIIGDEEVQKKRYQLKNMKTGVQTEATREEIRRLVSEPE